MQKKQINCVVCHKVIKAIGEKKEVGQGEAGLLAGRARRAASALGTKRRSGRPGSGAGERKGQGWDCDGFSKDVISMWELIMFWQWERLVGHHRRERTARVGS